MSPTAGGTILESEDADTGTFDTSDEVKNYTGTGYVILDRNKGKSAITWNYTAPVAGRYVLEFRYITPWDREADLIATINGTEAGRIAILHAVEETGVILQVHGIAEGTRAPEDGAHVADRIVAPETGVGLTQGAGAKPVGGAGAPGQVLGINSRAVDSHHRAGARRCLARGRGHGLA